MAAGINPHVWNSRDLQGSTKRFRRRLDRVAVQRFRRRFDRVAVQRFRRRGFGADLTGLRRRGFGEEVSAKIWRGSSAEVSAKRFRCGGFGVEVSVQRLQCKSFGYFVVQKIMFHTYGKSTNPNPNLVGDPHQIWIGIPHAPAQGQIAPACPWQPFGVWLLFLFLLLPSYSNFHFHEFA